MLAYKFLRHDRRGVHTGWSWPVDEWVDSGDVDPCRSGIHACAAEDVAWWLASDLWLIELDGAVSRARHKIVARRGRLLHPFDTYPAVARELGETSAWRTRDRVVDALMARGIDDVAGRFAASVTLSDLRGLERELDGLDDAEPLAALLMLGIDVAEYALAGEPQEAPFIACCAAGVAAGIGASVDAGAATPVDRSARATYDGAFDAERRWQSGWLAERLPLR